MDEHLKITKESVLRAAKKCSQAKDILCELFPEVFEKSINYKDQELLGIILRTKSYSGYIDCEEEEWLPRERYLLANILQRGIRAVVFEELSDLGPENFCKKYRYVKKKT